MKITWTLDKKRYRLKKPHNGSRTIAVPVPCKCGCDSVTGIRCHNDGLKFESDAICPACELPRGKLVTEVDTMFGLEEDERVLNGKWSVY